jgi:two-component system nitrogen regulation response regulator GlnG
MSVHLFLISSDPTLGALAARAVTGLPIQLQTAQSLTQAQALLTDEHPRAPMVLLLDLAKGDYLQARHWVQQWAPRSRAFFIAPQSEPGVWSREGLRWEELRGAGAAQLLPRPSGPREQAELFGRILSEATVLADVEGGTSGFDDLIGRSVAFRNALEQGLKAAAGEQPVLLVGEPGTGKRFFARAIHAESKRAQSAFVTLNCGALTRETIGAELFGAAASRAGAAPEHALLREADGGTLFLKEIGALERGWQTQLASFIDEGRLTQVHGSGLLRGVRLITSTSQDLAGAVHGGVFHAELHQRLRNGEIRIPPLRERPSDILLMAEHFLGRCVPQSRGRVTLSDPAKQRLIAYAWPGNVRELIGVLQVASLNAEGSNQIEVDHLPDSILFPAKERKEPQPAAGAGCAPAPSMARIGVIETGRTTRFTSGPIVIELPEEGIAFDDLERAILRAAMARTRGNVVRAARLLRLGRGSLRYRLEKHGIVQPKRRRPSRRRAAGDIATDKSLSRAS